MGFRRTIKCERYAFEDGHVERALSFSHRDDLGRLNWTHHLKVDRLLFETLYKHVPRIALQPSPRFRSVRNVNFDDGENILIKIPLVPPETIGRIVPEPPQHAAAKSLRDLAHRLAELCLLDRAASSCGVRVIGERQRDQHRNNAWRSRHDAQRSRCTYYTSIIAEAKAVDGRIMPAPEVRDKPANVGCPSLGAGYRGDLGSPWPRHQWIAFLSRSWEVGWR